MAQTKPQAKVVAPKATTRVQLELPERSMTRLSSLKEATESSSYAEVMKNALRLYEDVIKEVEEGKELLLKDRDGNVYPYRVFGL
jgi:IS1 family transposase